MGAAIAPPSVLQERTASPPALGLGGRAGGPGSGSTGSIAAKIMARYGYKVSNLAGRGC